MESPALRRASAVIAVGGGRVAQHEAVDELHHVERRAVHGVVGAEPERRRHGDVGGSEGGDDLVLAAHVVGGGEHVAERRAAQHPVVPSASVTP